MLAEHIQPRVCLSCLVYELPRINVLQVKIVNQNVHGFGGGTIDNW